MLLQSREKKQKQPRLVKNISPKYFIDIEISCHKNIAIIELKYGKEMMQKEKWIAFKSTGKICSKMYK